MAPSLFGKGTAIAALKGGLQEASATHRGIAARIQRATTASSKEFSSVLGAAQGRSPEPEIDLQAEMASLADTQLRYEATAKMLNGAYEKLRVAMRDRG